MFTDCLVVGDLAYRILLYQSKWVVVSDLVAVSKPGFQKLARLSPAFKHYYNLLVLQSKAHHRTLPLQAFETELCHAYENIQKAEVSGSLRDSIRMVILCDLQCLNFGLSPLTVEPLITEHEDESDDNESDARSVIHEAKRIAADPDFRHREMTQLYQKLPPAFMKAKAAYLMALYMLHDRGDRAVSEQVAFESLYILDLAESISPNSPPILSSLGYNALRLYGELLLLNHKVAFGIQAFETSIVNLRIRNKPITYAQLSHLAQVCTQHQRLDKATIFYKLAIEGCMAEHKPNEVTHLIMLLCRCLVEMGQGEDACSRFAWCIDYLSQLRSDSANGTSLLGSDSNLANVLSTHIQKVTFHYAQCLFENDAIDKALMELEKVVVEFASPSVLLVECILLMAQGYARKMWFKECIALLSLMEPFRADDSLDELNRLIECSVSGMVDFIVNKVRDVHSPLHMITLHDEKMRFAAYQLAIKCALGMNQPRVAFRFFQVEFHDLSRRFKMILLKGKTALLFKNHAHHHVKSHSSVAHRTARAKSNPSLGLPRFLPRKQSQSTPRELLPAASPSHEMKPPETLNLKSEEDCVVMAMDAFHQAACIGDSSQKLKAETHLVSAFLAHVFPSVTLSKVSIDAILNKMNETRPPSSQFSVEVIRDLAIQNLNSAIHLHSLKHIATGYINMAEICWLAGNHDLAIKYWAECRNFVWTFYIAHVEPAWDQATSNANFYVLAVLKRLARLLTISRNVEFAKSNFVVYEALIHFDRRYNSSQRGALPRDYMERRTVSTNNVIKRADSRTSNKSLASDTSQASRNRPRNYHQTYPLPSDRQFSKRPLIMDVFAGMSSTREDGTIKSTHTEGSDVHSFVSVDTFETPNTTNAVSSIPSARRIPKFPQLQYAMKMAREQLTHRHITEQQFNYHLSNLIQNWCIAMSDVRDMSPFRTSFQQPDVTSLGTHIELAENVWAPSFDHALHGSVDSRTVMIMDVDDYWIFVCLKIGLMNFQRMASNEVEKKASRDAGNVWRTGSNEQLKSEFKTRPLHQTMTIKIVLGQTWDCFVVFEVPQTSSLEDCIHALFKKRDGSVATSQVSSRASEDNISTHSRGSNTTASSISDSTSSVTPPPMRHREVKVLEMTAKAKTFIEHQLDQIGRPREDYCFATKVDGDKVVFEKWHASSTAPISELELVAKEPITFWYILAQDVSSDRPDTLDKNRRHLQHRFIQHTLLSPRDASADGLGLVQCQNILREMRLLTFPRLQAALAQIFAKSKTSSNHQLEIQNLSIPLLTTQACAAYPWEMIVQFGCVCRRVCSFPMSSGASRRVVNPPQTPNSQGSPSKKRPSFPVRVYSPYYSDELCVALKQDRLRREAVASSAIRNITNHRSRVLDDTYLSMMVSL